MRIIFRRSGGFAPMPIGCELDDMDLNEADQKQLKELIDNAELTNQSSCVNKQVRDAHLFQLKVQSQAVTTELKYDQTSLPKQLKPLIDFLVARAHSLLTD